MDSSTWQPMSLRSKADRPPLMAPWVPTFINTGVWTVPWGVVNWPRRAFPSVFNNSNMCVSFSLHVKR